mmetsp:Transcript_3027/g.9061  ORF Transcript_3027/g.9061 Transcript_3027/m.9061 type:complete len:123 (-) Transcript_3027:209-577(-)
MFTQRDAESLLCQLHDLAGSCRSSPPSPRMIATSNTVFNHEVLSLEATPSRPNAMLQRARKRDDALNRDGLEKSAKCMVSRPSGTLLNQEHIYLITDSPSSTASSPASRESRELGTPPHFRL